MATRKSTGPSLNQVVIRDPELEAYKLKLSGKSLYEIQDSQLGFRSSSEVSRAIKRRLSKEARLVDGETRESLLELELARLDALQAAVWDEAMSGEPKAVDSATKIIMARVKVLGLDIPDASRAAQTVLVIGGDEPDYIKALQSSGQSRENGTEGG